MLAERPVRVLLPDSDLARAFADRVDGFITERRGQPWLDVSARIRGRGPGDDTDLEVRAVGEGFYLHGAGMEGQLTSGPPYRADVCAVDDHALARFVLACITLLVPRDGRVLLHADCVEVAGRAFAFLGRSGAGKSTAAAILAEAAGASRLAADRTLVTIPDAASRAAVLTLPRLSRDERLGHSPRRVPLAAMFFPSRAGATAVRLLGGAERVQRLLGAAISPMGEGTPAIQVLDNCLRIAQAVPVAVLELNLLDAPGKLNALVGETAW